MTATGLEDSSRSPQAVDLHLHTTASDGLRTPERLVDETRAAGLTTIAIADHDTVAAVPRVAELCEAAGIGFVTGIEVTAVAASRDVHILGYFLDPGDAALRTFLERQRAARVARVRAIADRLAALGVPIDLGPLLAEATRQDGRSVGRPQIARALVAAGHGVDTNDAFDRWLEAGRPAFVARSGSPPEDVIRIIHAAGGLASLAHPAVAGIDAQIPALAAAGLDALEVYHPDHDAAARSRYLQLARGVGLLVTGGSDYHGDPAHGVMLGSVTLPPDEWARLQESGMRRHRGSLS